MEGRRVFPIEWHVSYWDYIGWVDTLASPAHEERQADYADVFGTGMYTPELAINAEEEQGSTNGATVAAHIDDVMLDPVTTSVTVWLAGPMDGETLQVGYDVEGAPAGTELWIVLVERDIFHEITAGENAGRTIEYDNVARTFATIEPGEGTMELDQIPDGVVRENSSLIAFVQEPGSMQVFGATDWHLTETF